MDKEHRPQHPPPEWWESFQRHHHPVTPETAGAFVGQGGQVVPLNLYAFHPGAAYTMVLRFDPKQVDHEALLDMSQSLAATAKTMKDETGISVHFIVLSKDVEFSDVGRSVKAESVHTAGAGDAPDDQAGTKTG